MVGKLVHVSGFLDFLNPAIQDIVMRSDVVVFQRNAVEEAAFDAIEYFQGMGKPVVIDLDDAYHILPWSNPAHKFWIQNEDGKALVMLEEGLRRSNGLIAPNRLLLSDWAHVCPGYYLPNYAEENWWTDLPDREMLKKERGLEGKIVIGWGGSVSHYDSWWGSGIFRAAQRICERHPEVVWMICGNDPRIHDQLQVSPYQKIKQPGVDPNQWPRIVKHFDIGVAPLFGPYDQRRSWIKGLEYMLAGIPWVCTAGEPYRDIQNYGKHVMNSDAAWEVALEEIIKRLPEMQTETAQLIPVAQQWFATNQFENFKGLFSTIINDARDRASQHGRLPGIHYV